VGENIATNKKAFFDYYIEEKFEAGLVLKGSEVKALRAARVNLKDGFIKIVRGEAFVFGVHIGVLDTTHHFYSHEERGSRKLLLHKKQIDKMFKAVEFHSVSTSMIKTSPKCRLRSSKVKNFTINAMTSKKKASKGIWNAHSKENSHGKHT
jgi:SsrA-binding protein